jgi:hypothetical protein
MPFNLPFPAGHDKEWNACGVAEGEESDALTLRVPRVSA